MSQRFTLLHLYAKNLSRRYKEHNALIKIVFLLPVFHLGIEIPFQGNGIEVEHDARRAAASRMFYCVKIYYRDQRVFWSGQAHYLVILAYGLDT